VRRARTRAPKRGLRSSTAPDGVCPRPLRP
jgi:hypothetical protein